MTCRPRELAKADAIVERALEVIRYLQPRYWFVENPRTGMLKDRGLLDGVTYVDVDYCQFCDWGYQKPTRIWGPKFLENLRPKVCDWRACPNLVRRSNGYLGHRRTLGATPRDGAPRIPLDDQYRIPRGVISYIFGWDRKDSDWKVPLVFRPPSYPPPPLKTANIQQSTANIPLPEPTHRLSKEAKLQHPLFNLNGDQWWVLQKIVHYVPREPVAHNQRTSGYPPAPTMPGAGRDRRQSDSRLRRRPTISRLRLRCRWGFPSDGGPKHEFTPPNLRLWKCSLKLRVHFSGHHPRVVKRHPPKYQTHRRSMSSVLRQSLTSSQTPP